jgi:hypothetical protein
MGFPQASPKQTSLTLCDPKSEKLVESTTQVGQAAEEKHRRRSGPGQDDPRYRSPRGFKGGLTIFWLHQNLKALRMNATTYASAGASPAFREL